ncbi:uncharacterized protein K452DRAFT_300878 [Aplosporella prunicola CBS 121167]|uniref:Uncharacterized protein n=1 Tax=Aplosporella prunicola CBS 121167 TaxID=1176127 RepID=A0A6A6B3J3_9PEZI|nr:uncharacterized protein K452DRAFT_300878 [Aplosporella prunicola CBS 121167]KAF2138812.1 hypothetical protein K452DRAFT_300878 [Aplosporella prunicola CBS 121167]
MPNSPNGIVVFSGGSAANSLVDVFNTVTTRKHCTLSYILPISDNGGSSSELIRVFGGPGIGDLRSRLVRLIPDDETDPERAAVKALFNHRLPADAEVARHEWLDIVEARHPLWEGIESAKKELIRAFLNMLNLEIVKRVRPSSVFNFGSASVGNLFLTGARLFSGSLESAIYLLSSICGVPSNIAVLPSINTNFSHHISAGLADGSRILGQNAISHPSAPTAAPAGDDPAETTASGITTSGAAAPTALRTTATAAATALLADEADAIEDANLPGSHPSLRRPNIHFSKSDDEALPSPITRIWYINPYGQEIRPPANPKLLHALASARAVVYSIGSLYTSIVPSLVLRGVGAAIARSPAKCRILLLNAARDRETGGLDALGFVGAVARAAHQSLSPPPVIASPTSPTAADDAFGAGFNGASILPPEQYRTYVTHVLHLDGPGAPAVDRAALARLGIETVRLYGRREGGKLRYDEAALAQALEVLVEGGGKGVELRRRNTLGREQGAGGAGTGAGAAA